MPIKELSKSVQYEFQYNYVKIKNCEKVKLFYVDTDSFTAHIKTDNICKNFAEGV